MRTIDRLIETAETHQKTLDAHKPEWDIRSQTVKDWLEMYGLCDRIKAEAPINTPLAERLTCRLEAMMSEAGYIE